MPFSNMPRECFQLWERVYNKYKEEGLSEEEAAKRAYGAIRQAGWEKNPKTGKWEKKSEVEFSLTIRKAYFDEKTQEMRWKADASDIDTDSYNDNMTLELFNDFLQRIQEKEKPPDKFCSSYWDGGMPYLSVAHYHDQDGSGVPGAVDAIYVDGKVLKAKGHYFDTPLGRACFKSVCDSVHGNPDNPVRVSIAFLDYKHMHKSNGLVFERKSLEDICEECLGETLEYIMTGVIPKGKYYLSGHLIHLAHTRVPVNKRTFMEVEKAMTTQLEDAASIVGEDLAEELEKKEKELVGKSEALVIRSEDEDAQKEPIVEVSQESVCEEEEKSEAEVEKAATKTVGGEKYPASDFLVVEDPDKPSTWHLQVKKHGKPDHSLMGAAKAALTSPGGHRGNKYEGSYKQQAITKLKRLYKEEGMEWESDYEILESISDRLDKMLSLLTPSPHPLDDVFNQFKEAFDACLKSDASAEERLQSLQSYINAIGDKVISIVKAETAPASPEKAEQEQLNRLVETVSTLAEKVEFLSTQLNTRAATNEGAPAIPPRRSISLPPSLISKKAESITPKLHEIIRKTVM